MAGAAAMIDGMQEFASNIFLRNTFPEFLSRGCDRNLRSESHAIHLIACTSSPLMFLLSKAEPQWHSSGENEIRELFYGHGADSSPQQHRVTRKRKEKKSPLKNLFSNPEILERLRGPGVKPGTDLIRLSVATTSQ